MDALCRLPSGDLVVDAKYERKVESANLHQMIAYCALSGATRAVLVVPAGVVGDRRAYLFERHDGAPIRVDIVELATDAPDVSTWRAQARALAEAITA